MHDVVRTGDPAKRGLRETDFPRIQKLAEGVYSYEQLRSAGAERFTTVSLIVVTPAGVLVADGQGSPEETKRLVDEVAKLTSTPITHVVIGSDHGDHTAGNESFPKGVAIFAHPASKKALAAMSPPPPPPTELVESEKTLSLGGREIRILFLGRAHTGGDLLVHLPKERILFMSEAYLNRIFPAMRSAYPSEWIEMIARAQAMDIDRYVPGHGFVESPEILEEELETFRRAIASVVAEVRRLHSLGLSPSDALARADFGELESWSLYQSQAPIAIRKVYEEMEGKLP
ncbi:MAG TPA: MBL fold metallo-hydrolase [Vicinamibacteria bacterium]|nr:MBL fold metallo-hydrolase [Vicinamibacteria bacterium]